MQNEKEKHILEKKSVLATIAIVSFLVAIYVAGVIIAHKVFLPNTYINDQNVGYKTPDIAEYQLLPNNTDFIIEERDWTEKLALNDFDYDLSFSYPLKSLVDEQPHFAWPLSFFKKTELDNAVNISYDEAKLKTLFNGLDAFDKDKVTEPQDAFINRDENDHYTLVPEVNGNQLDAVKAYDTLRTAVDGGFFDVSFEENDCYEKPEVYSDDKMLNEQMRYIELLNEETITIDLTGAVEVLDTMELIEFVNIEENGELSVKEDMLSAFVAELASKYNTYLSTRDFTTHSGKVISVGGNHTEKYGIDTYGFLMNQAVTANILRGCILSKESQTMYPAWDVPALTRDSVNGDIGSTYIELSLSEQHLWYYRDGSLFFDADVVTGLDTDQRRTPWGVFRAYEKDKDCTLKGGMAGERWNTHVDYWISVTWTGCGIHDATWQPSFGGNRYKTAGSHGCINVSLDTAKTLYDNVAVDTPIIIY